MEWERMARCSSPSMMLAGINRLCGYQFLYVALSSSMECITFYTNDGKEGEKTKPALPTDKLWPSIWGSQFSHRIDYGQEVERKSSQHFSPIDCGQEIEYAHPAGAFLLSARSLFASWERSMTLNTSVMWCINPLINSVNGRSWCLHQDKSTVVLIRIRAQLSWCFHQDWSTVVLMSSIRIRAQCWPLYMYASEPVGCNMWAVTVDQGDLHFDWPGRWPHKRVHHTRNATRELSIFILLRCPLRFSP